MGDLFNDSMLQVLILIIGILTIFVMILIFLLSRKNKTLAYQILSNNPILLKGKEIEGKLQILFNSQPVEDVYLSVVRLINSGNTQIETKDYDNVYIDFGAGANILTAEVTETKPDKIKVNTQISNNKLLLEPLLLNRRNSITLKFIVSHFTRKKITVEGRISGGEIKELKEGYANVILTLSGFALFIVGNSLLKDINYYLLGIGLGFIGALLMMVFSLKSFIDIRKERLSR